MCVSKNKYVMSPSPAKRSSNVRSDPIIYLKNKISQPLFGCENGPPKNQNEEENQPQALGWVPGLQFWANKGSKINFKVPRISKTGDTT